MKYDDLFFRGGFIGLLNKYGINVRKWAKEHLLILILMILIGLTLLYLIRTYYIEIETKWSLLLTALIGLAGGWLLSLNLFRHLGVNKNAFLREVFPMELTSNAIPTIVVIINKKMMWVYLFWIFVLLLVDFMYIYNDSNIYMFIFLCVSVQIGWFATNFLLVLYLCYKKIS